MISSKGRYALRVMLDMAEHNGDGYLRLSDIAKRQDISRKYLESIMPELCKNGLVESALGKSGGYRLTRRPEEYRIGQILWAAEGKLALVACVARDGKKCEQTDICYTLPFWQGLEQRISDYVDGVTLQDLLNMKTERTTHSCGFAGQGGKGETNNEKQNAAGN